MAVTEGKKKRPPTFHYLPKTRAKRLKKSWIEDHKIRSNWRAQRKREGLTNQTRAPGEDDPNHRRDERNADTESDPSPNRPDKLPTRTPSPPHDKESLRDLRRIAYASKSPRTRSVDSSQSKRAPGHSHSSRGRKTTMGCETGQPNMKLRMNVLLEKIKRDIP